MRVVLDANVVVSAFATRGLCQAVFEVCLRNHGLYVSESLLQEIRRAFGRIVRLPKARGEDVIAFLRARAHCMEPAEVSAAVCRDPDDLHVLGLALAASADLLVTGDEDLLVLKRFRGIPIVSPRRCWELLRAAPPAAEERGR